uniref:hypothetical protein n=1 Tax=Thiolapillus sp. TaxID=2017437 RepID=UPI0025FAA3A9
MFSLWRKARRENSAASRLLGSTSLRFALHGWQRLFEVLRVVFMEKRTPKNSTNVVLRLLVEFGEGNCALTHAG